MGDENKMRALEKFKTIFFSKDALDKEKEFISPITGLFSLLVTALIFVIPTDYESLINLPGNYVPALIGMILVYVLTYLFISAIKKEFLPLYFFNSVSFFLMLSLLVIAVPAFLISHWLVNIVFKNPLLGVFLFSLIPYYNLVLFGWLCEMTSDEKKLKGILIALFAITMLFSYQNLLALFTV